MRLMHIKNVEGRNRDEKFKFAVNCTNPYVRSLQYNFFICFFFNIQFTEHYHGILYMTKP